MDRRIARGGAAVALAVAGLLTVQTLSSPAVMAETNAALVTESVAAEVSAAQAEAEQQAREEAERKAREEAAARASRQGIAPSAYTGPYYDPGYDATRQCIVAKESGGNYDVVSSNGLWHGAYQFTQGTSDAAARQMGRGDLVGVPANQWSRADQDQAFWTIWNHGAGRHNWPTANGC